MIKHITSMFSEARDTDGQIGPEMITGLSNMSHTLTDDLLRNPPVTFSLAKVKERDEYTFVHSFNIALLIGHLALRLYPGQKRIPTAGDSGRPVARSRESPHPEQYSQQTGTAYFRRVQGDETASGPRRQAFAQRRNHQ